MLFKNCPHFPAEIAFDFENDAAQSFVGNFCFVSEKLLGEGIHRACRFSGPRGADDDGAREQTARWNSQPIRVLSSNGLACVVAFPDDNVKLVSCLNARVRRQRMWLYPSPRFQREYI